MRDRSSENSDRLLGRNARRRRRRRLQQSEQQQQHGVGLFRKALQIERRRSIYSGKSSNPLATSNSSSSSTQDRSDASLGSIGWLGSCCSAMIIFSVRSPRDHYQTHLLLGRRAKSRPVCWPAARRWQTDCSSPVACELLCACCSAARLLGWPADRPASLRANQLHNLGFVSLLSEHLHHIMSSRMLSLRSM